MARFPAPSTLSEGVGTMQYAWPGPGERPQTTHQSRKYIYLSLFKFKENKAEVAEKSVSIPSFKSLYLGMGIDIPVPLGALLINPIPYRCNTNGAFCIRFLLYLHL